MPNYSGTPTPRTALARSLSVSGSITPTVAPQQGSPGADPLPCHRCGAIDQPRITPGKGPHASAAQCAHCGHFIQWLSTRSPAERQVRRQQAFEARPPTAAQLAYLPSLGDQAAPPASMLEASTRIDARVRGEVIR